MHDVYKWDRFYKSAQLAQSFMWHQIQSYAKFDDLYIHIANMCCSFQRFFTPETYLIKCTNSDNQVSFITMWSVRNGTCRIYPSTSSNKPRSFHRLTIVVDYPTLSQGIKLSQSVQHFVKQLFLMRMFTSSMVPNHSNANVLETVVKKIVVQGFEN